MKNKLTSLCGTFTSHEMANSEQKTNHRNLLF